MSSKYKDLRALQGRSDLAGGRLSAGGQDSAIFFLRHGAALWHPPRLLKIALALPRPQHVGGCSGLQLDFTFAPKRPRSRGRGWKVEPAGGRGAYVCACLLNYYFKKYIFIFMPS